MNKPKITFHQSFFDSFAGTQEELDELVKLITETVQSNNFVLVDPEINTPIDLDTNKADPNQVNHATRTLH